MSKLIDAVAAVFCYQDKIYAIKRQNYLKAFPGYTAFPGGKVDKKDYEFNSKIEDLRGYVPHLMGGLVRELKEELDFDLEEAFEKKIISGFYELGLAITPDFNPVRFATYFFRIDLTHEVVFRTNTEEAFSFGWEKACDLDTKYKNGELLIVPPILKIIHSLAQNPGIKKIEQLDFQYDANLEQPLIESVIGVRQMPVPSNTLFPATRTNCFIIGDQDNLKVAIDPSPKDKQEMRKLIYNLKKYQVSSIMLTHHHGDHLEFSTQICHELNLPLYLSRDCYDRLNKNYGPTWFKGVHCEFLKEGDVLTKWLGEDVKIYSIPGHDEGHLGLAPDSLKWFIVGDLFQGVGTVVIGGSEGDMAKYFATLERIIKLDPKVVFPSHGIGLGSPYILEKTLEHRKMREEQIRNLFVSGKSIDEILAQVYFDVDQRLHKYAKANIESHLKKLREERKI